MAKRPNFLIFMTDQQQADVVFPEHPCITPNAQRLAQEGLLFRQAYCPTAHCCPSRATFFSGLYPSRHGIYNNVSTPTAIHRSLNPGVELFSQALRKGGYTLKFSGKWHVSGTEDPSDRGWDEVYVTAGKNSYMHRSLQQWREMACSEEEKDENREPGVIRRPGWGDFRLYGSYESSGPNGYEDHPDYKAVSAGISALKELAEQNGPWALFIGPVGPHDPYIVPKQFLRLYDPQNLPMPPAFEDSLEDKPRVYQRMRRQYWSQLSGEEVRQAAAHYWAYCTMEDAMLGEVLDVLEASGEAENTVVIFLSDHGDYCGAHGLYLKGVPAFRQAYNIPCIIRWPEGITDPGREIDEFVSLADFAPTFLELAGLSVPEDLTGQSLVPFFRAEVPEDWRDAMFTQFNGVELYYSQRAVITKKYKYVYNGFDFDELYDLESDPHETVNLVERLEYKPVVRQMVQRMWQFAAKERDEIIFNPYGTVALAPWGPAEGLRSF